MERLDVHGEVCEIDAKAQQSSLFWNQIRKRI